MNELILPDFGFKRKNKWFGVKSRMTNSNQDYTLYLSDVSADFTLLDWVYANDFYVSLTSSIFFETLHTFCLKHFDLQILFLARVARDLAEVINPHVDTSSTPPHSLLVLFVSLLTFS